jgi:hypothetical protein
VLCGKGSTGRASRVQAAPSRAVPRPPRAVPRPSRALASVSLTNLILSWAVLRPSCAILFCPGESQAVLGSCRRSQARSSSRSTLRSWSPISNEYSQYSLDLKEELPLLLFRALVPDEHPFVYTDGSP